MVLRLSFDGACGKAGKLELISFGVVGYIDGVPEPSLTCAEFVGYGTNNMAEWEGFKKALELVLAYYQQHRTPIEVMIVGDSQLIVNQWLGKFEVRKPWLKTYYDECRLIFEQLPVEIQRRVYVRWLPRAKNTEADDIAGKAMNAYLKSIVQ